MLLLIIALQSRGEEGTELPAGEGLTESTNNAETNDKEVKEPKEKTDKAEKAPRPPRERRERGPPADGIPSKNKVMVANLPYDLSEEKVRSAVPSLSKLAQSNKTLAQGTLRCLRAILRQDCPPPHPPLHGQEAPSPQRTPQGTWLRLRDSCL